MKRRTAWVLLLCTGIPTPALWRQTDKSAGARRTGTRVSVSVRPAGSSSCAPRQPTARGWLSDDPQVAAAAAAAAQQSAGTTCRPRRDPAPNPVADPLAGAALQQPAGTTPVATGSSPTPPAPARPRQPRTKAEKAAADRASWPTSWDALASGWDRTPGA